MVKAFGRNIYTIRLIGPSAAGLLILAGCATRQASSVPQGPASVPAPASLPAGGRPSELAGRDAGAPSRAPEAPPRSAPDNAPRQSQGQSGGQSGPLTVEEAVGRAETCSPQVRALRAAVVVAKQRKSAATDIQNPEALAAWGNLNDEFGDPASTRGNVNKWRAGGRVYVPNPFLMVPQVSARTADFLAVKADLLAAQWLVECDVRRSFAEIRYLAEDIALVEDLVRENGEILKDVRLRAQQGAATASDVVAATERQLQAQNDLDLTRHRYQLAQRNLAALLDLPLASLQIETNAPAYAPLPEAALSFDLLQEVALRCRGDVAALRWRTLAAKSDYREARNVRIPWLKDVTTWSRQPSDEWWVGVAVNVPIFSWTKNHADDVARAEYDLAGVNEVNGAQVVRREIREAVDELELQRSRQARSQSEIAPLIAEMRKTLQLLKATPNLMPYQVAATEAQITESLRVELAARWRYQIALLNLERVVGEPISAALPGVERKM